MTNAEADIRLLTPADANVLAHCADGVFDDPLIPGRLREFLNDPRHHLAVAVADGVVVGFVSAVHYVHPDKPRPELWINEIGVAPPFQQRGIGRALLTTVLNHARALGCIEAWVLTDRSNAAAMALYAACGGDRPRDQVMIEFDLDETAAARHHTR